MLKIIGIGIACGAVGVIVGAILWDIAFGRALVEHANELDAKAREEETKWEDANDKLRAELSIAWGEAKAYAAAKADLTEKLKAAAESFERSENARAEVTAELLELRAQVREMSKR